MSQKRTNKPPNVAANHIQDYPNKLADWRGGCLGERQYQSRSYLPTHAEQPQRFDAHWQDRHSQKLILVFEISAIEIDQQRHKKRCHGIGRRGRFQHPSEKSNSLNSIANYVTQRQI